MSKHADCSPAALAADVMLHGLFDQLEDAFRRNDGDAAVTVLHHMETIAGRQFVHRLNTMLIATVLARLNPTTTDTI
jgi:hypothetical protein